MNCAGAATTGSGGNDFKEFYAHLLLCNFNDANTAALGIARQSGPMDEIINQPLYEELAGGTSTNPTVEYVAYYTPSGVLVVLPQRAKPHFNTSTAIDIPKIALVGFELDGGLYKARYVTKSGVWHFEGYFKKINLTLFAWSYEMSLPYDFPQTQQDIERSENAIVDPTKNPTMATNVVYMLFGKQ